MHQIQSARQNCSLGINISTTRKSENELIFYIFLSSIIYLKCKFADDFNSLHSGVLILLEAVVQRCSVKKVFLEILQNSQKNTCVRVSFLMKLQASAWNFIKKETLAQVFSCEFCKISKNIFSYRTSTVAASVRWIVEF